MNGLNARIGAAADLSEVARPPFDIVRAQHAELLVSDLEAAEHFYVDLLGFLVTERADDALYLRGWEERLHHSLVLRSADDPAAGHLAFRVRQPGDLDRLAAEFERRGCQRRWIEDESAHGRALRAQDPFGFPLEFFHEMDQVPSQLQRYDLHRGAPIMRLDHFNLHSADVEGAFRFWRDLGFRCTEYIATDGQPERISGLWLTRESGVHDLALTAGSGPRLHHIGLWVAESVGVLRACDQLAAAGHASSIERGPGRHGVTNAFFVYLRDPDGHRIELYASDYYTGDPGHAPIRWSVNDPSCRSFWGARAPDSWYEESSTLLDLDGRPVESHGGAVDERTELMA